MERSRSNKLKKKNTQSNDTHLQKQVMVVYVHFTLKMNIISRIE